jgi:hypothetical protein
VELLAQLLNVTAILIEGLKRLNTAAMTAPVWRSSPTQS